MTCSSNNPDHNGSGDRISGGGENTNGSRNPDRGPQQHSHEDNETIWSERDIISNMLASNHEGATSLLGHLIASAHRYRENELRSLPYTEGRALPSLGESPIECALTAIEQALAIIDVNDVPMYPRMDKPTRKRHGPPTQ